MLRLAARHADIWNAVGSPEELAAINERLDEACRAVGRDPATLARTVSPRINLLASADAFAAGVAAYRAIGFRDIYLPWPRTDAEVPVLREAARDLIPALRGEAPAGRPPADRRPADLAAVDAATILLATAAIPEGTPRRLLEFLVEHPNERFDGAALRERLGLERHEEVARGFAAIAAVLARHGLGRPWNEAQAGYLLPAAQAAILARASSG
jgi:hypothetical protein